MFTMLAVLVAFSFSLGLGAAQQYGYQSPYYEPYPHPDRYQQISYRQPDPYQSAYQNPDPYQHQDPYGYPPRAASSAPSGYEAETAPSGYEAGYPLPSYEDSYAPSPNGGYYDGYHNDPGSLKSSGQGGGYGSSSGGGGGGYTRYVPVVHKPKKKKQKIISINKGFFIPGGSQAFGKFKSLKACMKACASSGTCFAGDYNPWLGKCYLHGNTTACETMSAHSKITHFKKVPCNAPGAENTLLTLGAQLFGGILQKGIKSLSDCIKKCVTAGGGIAALPSELNDPDQGGQICFGIDYDFSSHKCYFHTVRIRRQDPMDGIEIAPLCSILDMTTPPIPTPLDLVPNSAVINMIFCPPRLP